MTGPRAGGGTKAGQGQPPIELIVAQVVFEQAAMRRGCAPGELVEADLTPPDWGNAERFAWRRDAQSGGAAVVNGYAWSEIATAIAALKMQADDEARAEKRAARASAASSAASSAGSPSTGSPMEDTMTREKPRVDRREGP